MENTFLLMGMSIRQDVCPLDPKRAELERMPSILMVASPLRPM